jgi:hypothetical protein
LCLIKPAGPVTVHRVRPDSISAAPDRARRRSAPPLHPHSRAFRLRTASESSPPPPSAAPRPSAAAATHASAFLRAPPRARPPPPSPRRLSLAYRSTSSTRRTQLQRHLRPPTTPAPPRAPPPPRAFSELACTVPATAADGEATAVFPSSRRFCWYHRAPPPWPESPASSRGRRRRDLYSNARARGRESDPLTDPNPLALQSRPSNA